MDDGLLNNATLSAILGGIVGGVVSLLVSRNAEKKARIYSRFESVEGVIDDLQCVASAYWRSSGRSVADESRLKELQERLGLKVDTYMLVASDKNRSRVDECIFNIFDLATGGDFESARRHRDKSRVVRLREQCSNLKQVLYID